jgi:leucyl/phenylalanyl-tRNA--protein transferase
MIPARTLVEAYSVGFFPMATRDGEIAWFSPDPRAILPLDRFHVPRRLARTLKTPRFEIAVNRAFRDTIVACGSRSESEGNWINDEIVESYCELHRLGLAHSVEARESGRLVGGLYGVSLGGAFFGESMFSHATDASKVALCALVERLGARGYTLLDIQWITPHLERFGAVEISRRKYLRLLESSLNITASFVD